MSIKTHPSPSSQADRPEFEPTAEMVIKAENLFAAMAWHGVVRPVVIGYQTEILREFGWPIRDEFRDEGATRLTIIRDPQLAYMLSESNFKEYDERCQLARRMTGLYVTQARNCPLLEAEMQVHEARRELLEAMTPTTGVSADQVFRLSPVKITEFVNMTLRLLAPWVEAERALHRMKSIP